jgi:hypothetical protein
LSSKGYFPPWLWVAHLRAATAAPSPLHHFIRDASRRRALAQSILVTPNAKAIAHECAHQCKQHYPRDAHRRSNQRYPDVPMPMIVPMAVYLIS